MSYDIELKDPVTGCALELDEPHQMKGGTYALGGSLYAELNITYNYAPFYYNLLGEKGIRVIYGKTGAESIPLLQEAANNLKDDVSDDYWEATEGNAKRALQHLIELAKIKPEGIWAGD